MTPVTAATLRTLPARVASSEVAAPRGIQLAPARPAAVLIPPVAVYVVAVGATLGVHAALIYEASVLTFLRLGTLVALHVPLLFVVRAIAIGAGSERIERAVVPAFSVILAVALDVLIPGFPLHQWTLALVATVSCVAGPLTRIWQNWWVRHRPARMTLLASTEWGADEAVRRLEAIPGLVVSNVVIPDCNAESAEKLLRRPVSGGPGDVLRMEKRVVVSCPLRDPAVGSVIARMVALGHHISSESSMLRSAEGRIDTELANPLNLLLGRPVHWFSNSLSRVMDVCLSALMLVLHAPLFLLISIAILIETGRPIFYRQRRVGARGRLFDVIKFRSMYLDAERRSGPVWATEDDPRITKVGRILRRTRMDELPQLFNVLVGQMALVGPRPERPHFFNELRRDVPLFELRTIVRPGITGWAQVRSPYASGSEAARAKLAYDLFYVTRRSPWFDLAILFETVGVAFSGKGAR